MVIFCLAFATLFYFRVYRCADTWRNGDSPAEGRRAE